MTLTPGDRYDDASGPSPGRADRRRGLAGRLAVIGALLVVVLVLTGTGPLRDWWARRLGEVTGGNEVADYVVGLVVGLLPVVGVAAGAFRTRGARRLFRMFLLGAAGFVGTYLLAPSPARYLSDHASARVFEHEVPGYLPGVVTGIALWVLLVVVGVLRARSWWRRVTRRTAARRPGEDGPPPRVIDI